MFEASDIYAEKIYSVIYVPSNPEKYTKYGIPKHYELVYFLSGETETHFDGKTLIATKGSIEFLPRNVGNEYYVIRKTPADCIDILFDTDCPMPQQALLEDFSQNPHLKELFFKIYRLWVQKDDGYQYKCMALLYNILAEIKSVNNHYMPNGKYKKIEAGVAWLNQHIFDKDLDYYTPCTLCNISYTYFKQLFIEKFGVPPVQYITAKRMEYALELMQLKRFSLTEIATRLGYENLYYFSRVFKKTYGVSPSKYPV